MKHQPASCNLHMRITPIIKRLHRSLIRILFFTIRQIRNSTIFVEVIPFCLNKLLSPETNKFQYNVGMFCSSWFPACQLISLALFLMATTSTFSQTMEQIHPNSTKVIAHRGASGSAPENTPAAIKKALAMGVDMVEIDVHLSQDGQVIVMHDHTLDRTTSGGGKISMTSSAEIEELEAGSWFDSSFAGEKVPTLDEVLQTVNGKAQLLIEVKMGEKFYDGIERTILSLIERYNAEDWCILQSFRDQILDNFKQLETEIPLHKLIVGPIPLTPFLYDGKLKMGGIEKYKDFDGINISRNYAKKGLIQNIHDRQQTTYVWTVNDTAQMQKLIDSGVDGIITNHPEYLTTGE